MNERRRNQKAVRWIGRQRHRLLRGVPKTERKMVLTNTWLVFEGDYGGQIYMTVPLTCIRRIEPFVELLHVLDRIAWGCNEGDGAGTTLTHRHTVAHYQRWVPEHAREAFAKARGCPSWEVFLDSERNWVSGGMGGGRLLNGRIWLHGDFLRDDHQCEQLLAWMESTPWAKNLDFTVDTTREEGWGDIIDVEACESTDPVALIEQTGA